MDIARRDRIADAEQLERPVGVRGERLRSAGQQLRVVDCSEVDGRRLELEVQVGGARRAVGRHDVIDMTDAAVRAVIAADLDTFGGWKAYMAGPPVMTDVAAPLLVERGLPAEDLHVDVFFTPETTAIPAESEKETVE